jgi:exodeoxyribonuclease-3
MRLVAWNANHNVRKRSLETNAAILDDLCPDVMVISETAPPAGDNPRGAIFIGGTPGLAVIAREGVEIVSFPGSDGAPPLSAGFSVGGDDGFDLLAIWPIRRPGEPSYHARLMAALQFFAPLLSSGRAVMAGDLNTSAGVVAQRSSHPRFVEAARELGLKSAYHAKTGEAHGAETVSTYRHASGERRAFHLDYCFVSEALLGSVHFEVDDGRDWYGIGDHRPVVLDVPLQPTLPAERARTLDSGRSAEGRRFS